MPAVDVNLISTVGRIRSLNDAQVQALADSIAEVGLLNPVTVYRTTIYRSGEQVEGYGLIAGAHRLEACKRLGLADIDAQVVELDELHRTIAECDENLCGTVLTPAERADFTYRRKLAYEQLHGTAEENRARAAADARWSDDANGQDGRKHMAPFTDDTAARTGQSERKVRRDAERGENVCNSALAMVKGTHLDKGKYLDQLKDISVDEQVKRVKADLARRPDPVDETRRSKIDAEVKYRAACAIAEFIAENSSSEQWDGLKADLYAAGAKNIADALSNIIGNSLPYKDAV